MSDILKNSDAYTQPSFSLKNRLSRLLWGIVYVLLFRPSPRFLHAWRSFVLRIFGAKIGKGCHVYPGARIWAPWNLQLDNYACIADDVTCYAMAKITLGEKSVISQGAHLCTGSHDYEDTKFPLYAKPIEVGANAWIAAEVFVCPGVKVGEGTVIGARSVVTKNMSAWMVCAGNPCREIKPRKMKQHK